MEHNLNVIPPASVIQIGGTSGSGKSTLVKMAMRAAHLDVLAPPPDSSFIRFDFEGIPVSVLGDYSVGTPGADPLMIKYKADWMFNQLLNEVSSGRRVLWEIVTMPGIERIKELARTVENRYYPVVLDIPVEVALAGQAERRQRRAWSLGKEPNPPGPNNFANTNGKLRGHISTFSKLGVPVSMCQTRQQAWAHLHKLLGSRMIDVDAKYLATVDKNTMDYQRWVATETSAAEFRELAKFPKVEKPKPVNKQRGLF